MHASAESQALKFMNATTNRTAPATPGANANDMRTNPQMGTDHWVLSNGATRRRSAQIRKPGTLHGRGNAWLMPVAPRKPRKAKPGMQEIPTVAKGNAKFRK